MRDLKNSGLGPEKVGSISKEMDEMIEREVAKSVETAASRILAKVDEPRVREIKIQITKQALEITSDVASGARIYISLESQQQLDLIAGAAPAGDAAVPDLRQQIEEQKTLEAKLDNIATAEEIRVLAKHPDQI